MRINLNPPADATAKNESTTFLMIRFAITYSVFLLIILLLMVHLHRVSTTRSEEDFWNQDQSTFESAVSLLDNNFTTMGFYHKTAQHEYQTIPSCNDEVHRR